MKLEVLLKTKVWQEMFSYLIIGLLAVGVDYSIYQFVRFHFPDVYIELTNFLAMFVGAVLSFFLNRKYTFKSNDRTYFRLALFIIIAIFGYLLSTAIILIGLKFNFPENYTKIVAIITVAGVQFVINKFVTFKL